MATATATTAEVRTVVDAMTSRRQRRIVGDKLRALADLVDAAEQSAYDVPKGAYIGVTLGPVDVRVTP